MPSASDELRNLMVTWFGDMDAGPPAQFLLARGWTEKNGYWSKPTESHNPSVYEVTCLRFLRDEWDHDWVRPLFQPDLAI
jgi:hypothetical protein